MIHNPYHSSLFSKKNILKDLKRLLSSKIMNPIDKMILFGSQTDGTASKYSDYDIIIILKNNYKWQDTNEILDWCYDIDLKYNIVTDIKIISLNELNSSRGKQPYVINALKNGISI